MKSVHGIDSSSRIACDAGALEQLLKAIEEEVGVVKLSDVARRAGVSIGTASRVINGSGNVSPEFVQAVQQAIEDLGYRPNMVARSLRRQHSQTLGLVVPDITNPFFAELALSVELAARARSYSVILGNSTNDPATEAEYVQNMVDRQVDGLMLVPTGRAKDVAAVTGSKPMVVLDRDIELPGADFVGADQRDGAGRMVRHLADIGHEIVACIAMSPGIPSGDERLAGYLGAAGPLFERRGLDVESYIIRGSFSFETGMLAMKQLLELSPRPTAVFASNDQQAIGAIRHCRDIGLAVPQDISIAGFDDIPLASLIMPRLTTVRQPLGEIGERAVEWLTERAVAEESPTRRVQRFSTPLEIRDSCAPPREQGSAASVDRGRSQA